MTLRDQPLAAIWLYCRDLERSAAFYGDALGLRPLADGHFDAGGVRISLHPSLGRPVEPQGSFLVFIVEAVDEAYEELLGHGVHFDAPPAEQEFGRAASFRDPDGHELWIWQPPAEDDERFPTVEALVTHYRELLPRLRGGA